MRPRRRWLRIAAQIAVLGLVAGAIGLWLLGSWIIAPARATLPAPPADLDARALDFAGDGSERVQAWFAAGTPGRGAVLLLHGVRANRMAMVERARFLHAAGYAVLLIDFRAHGASDGDAITFGLRESRDVVAALAQLRRLAPNEKIGVLGTSMGGAAALLADPPLEVDALVVEQVYPTLAQALDDRLRLHLGPAGPWLSRALVWSVQPRLHLSVDELRPIERIAVLGTPKLVIGGDADEHTRVEETRAMFAAAAEPKELWIVPGARHVDLSRYAGDEYRRRIVAFFEPRLRGGD